MGVNIGSSFDHDVDIDSIPPIAVSSVGPVGPVTISGIPDTYHIDIQHIPKIELSVDPLEIKPLDVSVRIKEIPSVRAHVPANYCAGFSLLGIELFKLSLCGETQVITEPYRPNPCEVCDPRKPSQADDYSHRVDTVLTLREE